MSAALRATDDKAGTVNKIMKSARLTLVGMTSQQRVRAALSHREPDRIPVDCGSCGTTGIHVTCVAALRDYYGLERRPVTVHEPYQMLGLVENDLQDAMGLDVTGVFPRNTMFGFPADHWKPWRMPNGLEVLVPGRFHTTTAANGDILIYPEGDLDAPPSGRMPRDGFFFDAIIRQQPIDDDRLDPRDNLEEFGPMTVEDLAHLAGSVAEAARSSRAVMANAGGTAVGDIALVPAPFLKHPKGIRDVAEWYMSTSSRRPYIHAVFERQCEYSLANLDAVHRAVGDAIDVVFICGTDFGTQTSAFCSAQTFRELYLPYYKRMNDWIHAHTSWKTFKHSCGAVDRFIPLFIEAGFDVLNPVQCSAAGMEPRGLKERYGDRLVFWGGGIDTQKVLPFGTPEQVRAQVLDRCRVFSTGGGFVFNSIHNIQAQTPVENIVAMIDAVHEFCGEPRGIHA
ncbi:MAG TPA: uroporphyrinogen decarboxylase family protein [Candidatus Sulfotelmatobacter sp.]|nr:uroporphyrinogen decarboxylase family protein [Candidatus Sulfotelmatobacter sp.]